MLKNPATALTTTALSLLLTASAGAADKVDFAKDIKPIFEQRCLSCHGPAKDKGDLRLHKKALTIRDKIVVPGDADASDLYFLVTLPADDPDVMPAKGDPLTKAQQDLVRDWINQGAVWPDGLELTPPAGTVAEPGEPGAPPFELKLSDAEKKAIEKVEAAGGSVLRVASNIDTLDVAFHLSDKTVTDQALAALADLPNVAKLNLAGTEVTDAGLAHLKGLDRLTHLHLEKTKVGDAGLAHLKGLENLIYLNLYATQVSDAGIDHLADLKGLEKVYLWQSKATKQGAEKLSKAVPGVYINLGWEAEKPAEPKEEPKEKKDAAAGKAAGPSISKIMKEGHKGGLLKKVLEGNASDAETKQLVAFYEVLVNHEPPKGDAKSWKQLTTKLRDAAKKVAGGDKGALEELKAASNCKACHSKHKP